MRRCGGLAGAPGPRRVGFLRFRWRALRGSSSHMPYMPVIALAALCLVLLTGLFTMGRKHGRLVTRGWFLVFAGFLLIIFGSALEHTNGFGLRYDHPIKTPLVRIFLQEIMGYGLGFITLALGLVRWRDAVLHDPAARRRELVQEVYAQHPPQELLSSLFRSSLNGILILHALRDAAGQIEDFEIQLLNSTAENILGRSIDSLIGKRLFKQFPCLNEHGLMIEANSVIKTALPYRDERQMTLDGKPRWYQLAAVKLGDGLAVTFADITDRKHNEEQLKHAANHDPLTGLANRAQFVRRVEQAINRSQRTPGFNFAVLFLDFDRFKSINDSLGHDIGDLLLQSIAGRLATNLRNIDTTSRFEQAHLPARLGGDEFVILLEDLHSERDAAAIADRLLRELSEPHELAGHAIVSTASIGVVYSDGRYTVAETVIRDADTAMYEAKSSGKARYVLFDERMHQNVVRRLTLERELRDATERYDFFLEFEPIIAIESGHIIAFEGLLRWSHPEFGLVQPNDFIGIAEELGLINQIGTRVIEQAAAQLAEWHRDHPRQPMLRMHINLSRHQLLHPELIESVRDAFATHDLARGSIVLEVTESMIMHDIDRMLPIFQQLRDAGAAIAMDDFGTGHSSLSVLHRLPIDILKIDRSFISYAGQKRDYAAIVQAVVELAHHLKMKVVAEGVEQPDHLTLLQALDCEFAQGHLISPPLSAAEAQRLVADGFRFTRAA